MRHLVRHAAVAMLAWSSAALAAPAPAVPADPLGSPMWQPLAETLFAGAPVRFDDRVKVRFPPIAENQRVFPVTVDARAVGEVRRMVLFADLNPIPVALDYSLSGAVPFVAVRIKLDQRTPVRAAVQLADGSWLVNGGWIDAAGGGCSAPPVSRVKGDWADHLGEIRGVALAGTDGARLRLAFRHPMDTGFVDNIPRYNIERLTLSDGAGAPLGTMAIEASVAEDPALTLIAPGEAGTVLRVDGRDTNGRTYRGDLAVQAATPTAGP